MTIQVQWDDADHTRLLYIFPEEWSWDDFAAVKAIADPMLDTVDHDVHLIFDVTHTQKIPSNTLDNIRRFFSSAHPRSARIIVVTTQPIMRSLIQVVRQFSPRAHQMFVVVESLEAAREIKNNPSE